MENEQEKFWGGEFGDEYTNRNTDNVMNNEDLFFECIGQIDLENIIEFGCNRGENLEALRELYPDAELTGVDVNKAALDEVKADALTLHASFIDDSYNFKGYDLAFTKGVLIHIAPENIEKAYQKLYDASDEYILICEYYNPKPREVLYRGQWGKLWKRDFAGEMLDRYEDLELVDYGFKYHRDRFPQDDITWFLMRKL